MPMKVLSDVWRYCSEPNARAVGQTEFSSGLCGGGDGASERTNDDGKVSHSVVSVSATDVSAELTSQPI